MTQYNSLNVKLSNSQLNKSAIKNESEEILRLSPDMIGNNENNFPHELLQTNRQVSNLCKSFGNNSSAVIKLSKTQLLKMIQLGGFLNRLLGTLLKTGLPLIKNVIKPIAKSVLIPLGLTAAASAAGAGIHKKRGFLGMLLGFLGASLLRNLLTGEGMYRAGKGKGINRAGEGIVRAGYGRPSFSASHNKMYF